MNSGRVRSGYQLKSLNAALNGISVPPVPQSMRANIVATKPMAPKTRCPVMSMTIIDANIVSAMYS